MQNKLQKPVITTIKKLRIKNNVVHILQCGHMFTARCAFFFYVIHKLMYSLGKTSSIFHSINYRSNV